MTNDPSETSLPIFASILKTPWAELPPVIQKHYANRPYSEDVVQVDGHLDVLCRGPMRLMAWVLRLVGSVPPFTDNNVPTTVWFKSDVQTAHFHFQRLFHFKGRTPYRFLSYMQQIDGDEVAEITRIGLGWRMRYSFENGQIVMQHRGYVFRLFKWLIPMPLEWLLGHVLATETPVDDNSFDMNMQMVHPLFGVIYQYKGHFKVTALP